VTHACNPSYFRGWDQEDRSSKAVQENSSQDPHLQNNQSKMYWKYTDQAIRVPALQVGSTEFKLQSCKNKK
jgi:hypothetical protein